MAQCFVFAVVAVLFICSQLQCLLGGDSLPPPCDSIIYCTGDLLHDVQLSGLFDNFVDLKLRYPEDFIYQKYQVLRATYDGTPPDEVLRQFVNDNFKEANEFVEWTPTDYVEKPSLVDRVADPAFKDWVISLNQIFRNLSRKIKDDVYNHPDLYSMIWLPNGFVIPGGIFTEIYYWDTYWILNGLLMCDMKTTARGILENFIHLIKKFSFIPNGGRKYYLRRTQPAMFIPMVKSYYEKTGDLQFIAENIYIIEQEFKFWEDNHMGAVYKDGTNYTLARYISKASGPRPESYRNDYMLAQSLKTEEERSELYVSLKSTAESGLDFSTKWFIKDGTNIGNLSDTHTTDIIPVELNAYLHNNALIVSYFNGLLNRYSKQQMYKSKADDLLEGINAVLWSEEQHMWFDYDVRNQKSREYFYLTNLAPLWTESYPKSRSLLISQWVLDYIRKTGVDQYIGGVPTSLLRSGQQWDFPNGWPPLQDICVKGLLNLNTRESKDQAFLFANKWIQSNYKGFKKFGAMFEKYDVTKQGCTGGGGEYKPQTGFGWSNGVVLLFLDYFGRELKWEGTGEDIQNITCPK